MVWNGTSGSASIRTGYFEKIVSSTGTASVSATDSSGNNAGIIATFPATPSTVSITFTSNPTGSGFITVNGSAQTTPYTIASAVIGDHYTVNCNSPANTIAGQSQYVFSSWNDSGAQSHTITVSTATTYLATFQLQYYLTVTGGNSATGQGWVNSGSTTTASSDWIWSLSGGQRIALSNWQLDSSNQNPARSNTGTFTTPTITMSSYHTVNFVSGYQYLLTVTGGHNVTYGTPSQTSDNWYDTGTSTTISSDWVWNTVAGQSRYSLVTWTLNGFDQYPTRAYNGTATTASIPMLAPHPLTFVNTTQYFLNSTTDSYSVISPSLWVDSGNNQTFNYSSSTSISKVLVDGYLVATSRNYTFTNVQGIHTISILSNIYSVILSRSGDNSPYQGDSVTIGIVVLKNGQSFFDYVINATKDGAAFGQNLNFQFTDNEPSVCSRNFTVSGLFDSDARQSIGNYNVTSLSLTWLSSLTLGDPSSNTITSIVTPPPSTIAPSLNDPPTATPSPKGTSLSWTNPHDWTALINLSSRLNYLSSLIHHSLLFDGIIIALIVVFLGAIAVFVPRRHH